MCALCRSGTHGFDAAYSFGSYEGTLKDLIHLFKYNGIHTLTQPLGRSLAGAIPRTERFDLVVPMPMHWWRKWRRGFNQAELLAADVARRMGLPLVKALSRKWQARPQAGLSRQGRRLNVRGVFRVKKADALKDRRVLLVDDVLTTGASASSAAKCLKDGGARYVAVLTLARVDRRKQDITDAATVAAEILTTGVA